MSKVMSMASSAGVFWSWDAGDGPSEVGFVIMGFLSAGGAGGRAGRGGGMFTGVGCWFVGGWVLAPSERSGITIICLPLL